MSFAKVPRAGGGSVWVFQLFSDIGPPRVEKLKVVEKCQKVEIHLRNFTKLIYMAPIFRCFRGVRVRKVESRIYMDLIFRCFQGVRVQKVESRFYIGRIFRCFQGSRCEKSKVDLHGPYFSVFLRVRGSKGSIFRPLSVFQ